MLPPDMARISIRVLGQCQKHGASLADDIAKWGFARFFSFDPFSEAKARTSPLPPITITNTHTQTHTLFHFCEIHPPFSSPDCINISQASWSEDPSSTTLTQAFSAVCLSDRPPRMRAGCILVQGRPASLRAAGNDGLYGAALHCVFMPSGGSCGCEKQQQPHKYARC